MTETAAAHPVDPFAAQALNAVEGLDPVDPAYGHVLRIKTLFNALPIAIAATVLDLMVVREIGGPYGLLTGLSWLLGALAVVTFRSEEHTSELQSLMRNTYAVFGLKKKQTTST